MTARDRIVVLVLAVVAALGGFWFLVISPKRDAIATADAELVTQQQRLDEARTLLATAQGAKSRYAADYAAVARLGKAVPADDNMASLVYDLQSVAVGAKVKFTSIKVGGASSGAAAAAGPSASGSSPSGSSSGSSSSGSSSGGSSSGSSSSGASAPATQLSAAQLPPGATVGTAGLATMPFSFIFEGSFLDMQRFLARVDDFVRVRGPKLTVNGRLLTVDGVSLTTADSNAKVKATIAATAYLAPADTGTSAATGAAPSGTASGSNTTTAITAAPAS